MRNQSKACVSRQIDQFQSRVRRAGGVWRGRLIPPMTGRCH